MLQTSALLYLRWRPGRRGAKGEVAPSLGATQRGLYSYTPIRGAFQGFLYHSPGENRIEMGKNQTLKNLLFCSSVLRPPPSAKFTCPYLGIVGGTE
jgi:hypothetical protein